MHAQDMMLNEALATMDAAVATPKAKREAPAPVTPRRTRIVGKGASLPEAAGTYTVSPYGRDAYTVEATTYGGAVVLALKAGREAGRSFGACVFMWDYTVTGPDGTTYRGQDIDSDLERARIERRY